MLPPLCLRGGALLRCSFGGPHKSVIRSGNTSRQEEQLETELFRCPRDCTERSAFWGLPGMLAALWRSTFWTGLGLSALVGIPAPAYRSLPVCVGLYSGHSSEDAVGLRPVCRWPRCRWPYPLGQVFAGVERPGLLGRGAPD